MTIFCINDKILAPQKCGTRYLRTLGLPFYTINMIENNWNSVYNIDWEMIVIRNPIEHLKSALQTELLNLYNRHQLWEGMTTKSVLERFINEYGCDHWYGSMYKKFYELWIHKNKSIKIVDLNDLSYFISMMGYYKPYDRQKFDFTNRNIWYSKDTIIEMVKQDYSKQYDKLTDLMRLDSIYYNKFNIESVNKKVI